MLFKITRKSMFLLKTNVVEKKSGLRISNQQEIVLPFRCRSSVDQDLGVIYISLDPAVLYHAIDNTRGHTPMAVTVTSPFDTEIFHIGETVDKESENWLVGLTSHGYQVQVAVPKTLFYKEQ